MLDFIEKNENKKNDQQTIFEYNFFEIKEEKFWTKWMIPGKDGFLKTLVEWHKFTWLILDEQRSDSRVRLTRREQWVDSMDTWLKEQFELAQNQNIPETQELLEFLKQCVQSRWIKQQFWYLNNLNSSVCVNTESVLLILNGPPSGDSKNQLESENLSLWSEMGNQIETPLFKL